MMVTRVFSRADLVQLIDHHEPPCISLFMPTHSSGLARKEDEIRLKNLVRDAERQLAEREVSSNKARRVLQGIAEVPQDLDFWSHRSDGLAIYASEDFTLRFTLPMRLEELAVVSDRFLISPLLSLLHSNGRYFILALTKESADLYEATRYSMVERELPPIAPTELEDGKPPLQYHSHRTSTVGTGGEEAIYHGHGGIEDREKVDVANFFKRMVDPGISDALRGQNAPLVLACVDYLAPIYREVNTYPYLLNDGVTGSPTELSENQLREKAWEIVSPSLKEVEEKALHKYEDLAGTPKTQAASELVVEAACKARVETLFVPNRVAVNLSWPTTSSLGDESTDHESQLIEEAAEHTLLYGGQVFAVDEVPEGAPLAAVLRY